MERLITGLEARAEGRTIRGTVIRFGDVSPSHRERFEGLDVPGAVSLNLEHSPLQGVAYSPGGGLTLVRGSDGLSMRAEVPPIPAGEVALHGVRSGRFRGLSVEFRARRERREGGIRVIERADLHGIGLVARPSYPASADIEARQSRYRARVPVRRNIDCRCAGSVPGGERVTEVIFDRNAFAELARSVAGGRKQVSAIARGAGDVVADTRTRSLELSRGRGGSLDIRFDPLDTEAGRRTRELLEAGVDVYARPVIDFSASEFEVAGEVARVSRADFSYVLVKPTDRAAGLEPVRAAREGRRTERKGFELWL